jgi:hypothetical protein
MLTCLAPEVSHQGVQEDMAINSDSDVDLAVLDCFLLSQNTGNRDSPVAMAMNIPLVDLGVHGQLAKSASVKTKICGSTLCVTVPMVTCSMVELRYDITRSSSQRLRY